MTGARKTVDFYVDFVRIEIDVEFVVREYVDFDRLRLEETVFERYKKSEEKRKPNRKKIMKTKTKIMKTLRSILKSE